MTRISFTGPNARAILDGTKDMTHRWRPLKIAQGQTVAAVTGRDGKPAFLTPVALAFAHLEVLRITEVDFDAWVANSGAAMPNIADRCGFESVDAMMGFYRGNRPDGLPSLWRYEFRVLPFQIEPLVLSEREQEASALRAEVERKIVSAIGYPRERK